MTTELTHRSNSTITPDLFLARYADDTAFLAVQSPATTLTDLASQLDTASSHLQDAGITNAEDLDTAATYVDAAATASGNDQAVLLKRASDLLSSLRDMADEYRTTL